MKSKTTHPDWALKHKKTGTELKLINGRYYLYGVKSVYDKTLKKSKKVSLGIIGSITEKKGLVPSDKQTLKDKSQKSYADKQVFCQEYGYAQWLMSTFETEGLLEDLKKQFPDLWQFIVSMVYCRTAHKAPLKNIPFYWEQSAMPDLLGWDEKLTDQKISDLLFTLGSMPANIHEFLKPKDNSSKTVLMDATDIVLQSNKIALAQKGYHANMDFQPQFVLLYLYDASSLKPLYYRLLPGNIREISALQNTIKISGMEHCVYIADKGFFSASNLDELDRLGMQFIIPLRRNNEMIPYDSLSQIEQTDNYFDFANRFIFFADTHKDQNRNINLFLDGKLKEQEKTDYLARIKSLPESYSKPNFNQKVKTMGTLALIHNTQMNPQEVYCEYKNRGAIEQFFDHLKNTLDASSSNMQREESLYGWMFINHLSMQVIYRLYFILKNTPLNKKQNLNHKYSINDAIEHLKSIKKIQFSNQDSVIAEINKATKTLLHKMNLSIT
jgi:transposase